jgi:N-acetylglucosaminyl-diphospho-decaprenol L-rhamnosyltransferase
MSLKTATSTEAVEVVVVDNGSLPGSRDRLAASYPDVSIIARPDNPGFAVSVNVAARVASGEYLLLLNPDTVVLPDAVARLADYLADHPDVAVVGARVYDANGTVQRSGRTFPSLVTAFFGRTSLLTALWPRNPFSRAELPADESTKTATEVDWVAGSCLMIRSSAFRSVDGMDERFFLYWEDADLCQRVRAKGWGVIYLPQAEIVHQVGRSSRHVRVRSIVAFHRSAFLYYAKHTRSPIGRLALPIVGLGLLGRMIVRLGTGSIRNVMGGRRESELRGETPLPDAARRHRVL